MFAMNKCTMYQQLDGYKLFKNSCSEFLFRIKNSCSEFQILVQNSCSEFRTLVQNSSSEFLIRILVQNSCSEFMFRILVIFDFVHSLLHFVSDVLATCHQVRQFVSVKCCGIK